MPDTRHCDAVSSGTGKSHIGLGLGLAACQKGLSVGFTNAAAMVHELIEVRDEKRLLRLQRQLAAYKLLIVDELGYVPLSQTGAELLFEVFSQRYERGSTIVTSNLPFDEWTSVFGSELYVGANFAATRHIVNAAEPVARQFSTDCRVTVNLGVLDSGNIRFLYRVTPGKPPGPPAPQPIPAHCSAIGKALLSGLPPIEAHAMLGGGHLARVTRNSLVARHLLFDDLERAHRTGYAIDNEENTNGLHCVAVPIFNEHHRPVAAISIAGPAQQLRAEQVGSFGRELVVAADRIMLSFGGRRPSM